MSVAGVALCGVPDVLDFFRYVSMFGNVFSPVAGVLVFDYLFVRRMQIDVAALYDPKGCYRYWLGLNPIAVAWTAIGFLICTYVISTAWIPALLTLLITGVGYLLTVCVVGYFAGGGERNPDTSTAASRRIPRPLRSKLAPK